MMNNLRDHPFAVHAWFDYSCTLTFALPKDEIGCRLPANLQPDTFQDTWGFLAVAIVKTRQLRPAGFPACLGHNFVLIGYRYFVRYSSHSGRNLRGLYIIRSETDQRKMAFLGNIFTRYRYVTTDVSVKKAAEIFHITSAQSGIKITADLAGDRALPASSPFSNWQEARKFSGPLPFTFSHDAEKKRMVVVEGVRADWKPRPIHVVDYAIPYLSEIGHANAVLANAFIVENIPYHWKKGVIEPCLMP